MSERILILGGAGFVGSSLAIGLKTTHPGWDLICFDNLRRRGSELNLPRLRQHGIRFAHGDIRNTTDLEASVTDIPAIVIDCSAEPSVLAGVTSPEYVLQTNLLGTINVLEFCRRTRAHLIFLSTSRVYSVPALRRIRLVEQATRFMVSREQDESCISEEGIAEGFSVQGIRSLYGTTKLASEMLIEEYQAWFGLRAIVNRCGVLAGPWQMGKVDQGVFVLWMAAHYFGRKLEYIGFGGTGKQVRDLLHVSDLLSLIQYQIEHFDSMAGEVFNVGGGRDCSLSLLEATCLCQEIAGREIQIGTNDQERPGDVPFFVADRAKIKNRTGWNPQLTPEETLKDIYQWIRKHEKILHDVLVSDR